MSQSNIHTLASGLKRDAEALETQVASITTDTALNAALETLGNLQGKLDGYLARPDASRNQPHFDIAAKKILDEVSQILSRIHQQLGQKARDIFPRQT